MKKFFLLLLMLGLCGGPVLVMADVEYESGGLEYNSQGVDYCPQGKMCLTNPAKADSVAAFFEAVFNAIFILILPIAVLAMAVVGLMFVAARGNPEKLTKAKNNFLYTILGTALVFGVLVLLKMLTSLAKALGGPV